MTVDTGLDFASIAARYSNMRYIEHMSKLGRFVFVIEDIYGNHEGIVTYDADDKEMLIEIDNFPWQKKYIKSEAVICTPEEFVSFLESSTLSLIPKSEREYPIFTAPLDAVPSWLPQGYALVTNPNHLLLENDAVLPVLGTDWRLVAHSNLKNKVGIPASNVGGHIRHIATMIKESP